MSDRVGPVLHAGPRTDALVAAIRAENGDVEVLDRGAYVRVSAPGRCRMTRAVVERFLGEPFELPNDLEAMMSSFAGRIAIDDAEVVWSSSDEGGGRSMTARGARPDKRPSTLKTYSHPRRRATEAERLRDRRPPGLLYYPEKARRSRSTSRSSASTSVHQRESALGLASDDALRRPAAHAPTRATSRCSATARPRSTCNLRDDREDRLRRQSLPDAWLDALELVPPVPPLSRSRARDDRRLRRPDGGERPRRRLRGDAGRRRGAPRPAPRLPDGRAPRGARTSASAPERRGSATRAGSLSVSSSSARSSPGTRTESPWWSNT